MFGFDFFLEFWGLGIWSVLLFFFFFLNWELGYFCWTRIIWICHWRLDFGVRSRLD